MKILKFAPHLITPILKGEKFTTWRLWDDKDLKVGDVIKFVNRDNLKVFAKGTITKVVSKPYKDLTDKDKQGHGGFVADSELFERFSGYYKKKVDKNTVFKIIWFEIDKQN